MERFQTYSEAKRRADALTKELAEGSKVPALTDKQAGDALAALQRLQSLYQSTGRRISLLAGIPHRAANIVLLTATDNV
jgi:hypothetical protein